MGVRKVPFIKILALLILSAGSLLSCVSELEDRIGVVEDKLTQVIKDVETLTAKLAELEAKIPADAIDKIATLTKRIETLESTGATDEEVKKAIKDAKDELNTTINTIPKVNYKTLQNGNIELSFSVGAWAAEKIQFVDPSQIVIVDNNNNTTTVTVGGKSFTFPTSVVMPSTISNIQVTTDPITADRMTLFSLKMWIGTTDGKQVELTKNNLMITNALTTKSSFFAEVNNLKIISVEKNGTELNEFNVIIQATQQSPAGNYSIAIKQDGNTQRSNAFNVTINIFSPLQKGKFTPFTAGATLSSYDANAANLLGSTTINRYTPANDVKRVEFKYINENGKDIADGLVNINSVSSYEILNATSYADAVTKTGLTSSVLLSVDNLSDYTAKSAAISNNSINFKSYPGCSIVDQKGIIGFTLPTYDTNKSVATRYYVVLINGNVAVDNVQIRQYGIVEIKSENIVRYALPATTFAAETSTVSIEVPDAHIGASYVELTGLNNVNVSNVTAKIQNSKGELVVGGVSLDNVMLNGTSNLTFKIVPTQSKLDAGVYTVTITDDYAKDKSLLFTMLLTITRSEVGITNTDVLGSSYSASGTFDSFYVKPLTKDFSFSSVVKSQSQLIKDVDYKVYYRLYTESASIKTYLDGKSEATAKADYQFAGTPMEKLPAAESQSVNVMAYDKSYNVEALVVYKSGYVTTVSTRFSFKYATMAKVDGFKSVSPIGGYNSILERSFVFGSIGNIDLSYILDSTKPFYFASKDLFYLDVNDTDLNNYSTKSIAKIEYSVDEIPFSAETMVGSATGNVRLVSLTSGNGVSFSLSYDKIKSEARLVFGTIANVTDVVAGKKVIQPVTATVTDIWGRVSILKINVTITPKQ